MQCRTEVTVVPLKEMAVCRGDKVGRGRPWKIIDASLLREAFQGSRKITQQQLAKALGVHRHTVRHYMRINNVHPPSEFSTISNEELDQLVKKFQVNRPDSGGSYLMGEITGLNIRVQRKRIRESQSRVDCIGVHFRKQAPIRRQ